MTKVEWLAQVATGAKAIRSLIEEYHPATVKRFRSMDAPVLAITAPDAEAASEIVRQKIKEETQEDPIQQFDRALKVGDIDTLMRVMDGAWWGVPESTGCWGIEGFGEAVEALKDPPEDWTPEETKDVV